MKPTPLRGFARAMRAKPKRAEGALWGLLRDRRFSGFKFRRQAPLGDYIADFVCFERRLIVEADRSQHGDSVSDTVRDAWFANQRFRVRRFWNGDILRRPAEVMKTIWADPARNPSSGPQPPPENACVSLSPARGEGAHRRES